MRKQSGGGQFGGFSGPDGMGVALRGLCKVLDYTAIDYHLRDFDDIIATNERFAPLSTTITVWDRFVTCSCVSCIRSIARYAPPTQTP